jgi:hypothetical protein
MRLLTVGIALALVTASYADTVRLKDGRVIQGTYLGGSARQVRMEVGDQIQSLDVMDIERIEFGGQTAAPAARRSAQDDNRPVLRRADNPPAADNDRPVLRRSDNPPAEADDRPILRREDNVLRPDADAPAPTTTQAAQGSIELPAGTNIVVRMIDGVDSETARQGQTFAAAIDQPVTLANGQVAIDRGADVVVKLVDAKGSGTFTGRAELALNLQSVKVNGRTVDVNSQSVSRVSDSRGNQTAKRGAAGAIVGAGLGAVFGGGKGAAEGAAVGGAAGAGTQVMTKGERVRIPSETRLTFVLDSPVRI